VIRQPVLGEQGAAAPERRTLHRERIESTGLGDDVVDVVHDVGHHQAVDHRHRRRLGGGAS
jgi:hypothetical protein